MQVTGIINASVVSDKRKAIVISGGRASSKTVLATQLAKFNGDDYIFTTVEELKKNKFIFASHPSTIIVEECHDFDVVYLLLNTEYVVCEAKGKDPVDIKTPNIICTTSHPITDTGNRFIVVSLVGGGISCK